MKKRWPKYLMLIVILSMIPMAIIGAFMQCNGKNFYNLTSSDWLDFSGAAISYIGTIGISLVALYQSERANELSEKVVMLTQREYIVNFSVEKIGESTIKNCQNLVGNCVSFCKVDFTPETCTGYLFTIKNYSNYPIVHIHISTSYPVGQTRMLETLERDVDVLIAPNEAQVLQICNTPYFTANGMGTEFLISCSNLFNNLSTLKICLGNIRDSEGNISFSTQLVENDSKDSKASR